MEFKYILQMAFTFSLAICAFVIGVVEINKYPIQKDCSLAEISPDFSTKERQMCRMLRSK